MNHVYLDNAAASAIDEEILKKYIEYAQQFWANPSSYHTLGRIAKSRLEEARISIAKMIGAQREEIFFASSSTIANNIVLSSFGSVIGFDFEHPSVEKTLAKNKQKILQVGSSGIVDIPKILDAIDDDTELITLMFVNNILGTIQPIQELSKALKKINKQRLVDGLPNILLHSDCSQAYKYLKCDVEELGVDMMTISSSKIYGPRGVSVLYAKNGAQLKPLFSGGMQEGGLISGTENVPCILSMRDAMEKFERNRKSWNIDIENLKKSLLKYVEGLEGVIELGDQRKVSGFLSLGLKNIEQETILTALDLKGFCVGAGSSCSSGALKKNQYLISIGYGKDFQSIVRISLGKDNTIKEINEFGMCLVDLIKQLSN